MKIFFNLTFLSLTLTLLASSCSDVKLTYGVAGGGLTTISDRNRNASTPANNENLASAGCQPPLRLPTVATVAATATAIRRAPIRHPLLFPSRSLLLRLREYGDLII